MKKFFKLSFLSLCMLVILNNQTKAQIQFATIKAPGISNIGIVPRISWNIGVYHVMVPLAKKVAFFNNFYLRNGGFIFNDDINRHKHRVIAAGTSLNLGYLVNDDLLLFTGYGLEYNFHYKHKIFENKERKQKKIIHEEWGSARVQPIGHYARVGFYLPRAGLTISGNFYFNQFFNQNFEENTNGIISKPYENIDVKRFDIGFMIYPAVLLNRD